MKRGSRRALLVGSLIVGLSGAGIAVGAEALRGLWTAEHSRWRVDKGGTATIVQLSLRRSAGRNSWNTSFHVPRTDLQGLTDATLIAPSADARFTFNRDAGTFVMEGRFQNGDGAGHFAFTPRPEYQADMKRRGYDVDDEEALSLAIHDVSRAFIDELAGLGYQALSLDQLTSLRIHGATTEYVRGLAALGYKKLAVDDLLSFRIHGVSPEYVRAFKAQGYEGLAADDLVSMRIHGVSPEFVKDLKGLGYSTVPVDDLVSMRIHGVSTDFIKRVQGRSGKAVSVDRLVSMRIHGEDRE